MTLLKELKVEHTALLSMLSRLEHLATALEQRGTSQARAAADIREAEGLMGRLLLQLGEHEEREKQFLFPLLSRRGPPAAAALSRMESEHVQLERQLIAAEDRLPSLARRSGHRFSAALKPLIAGLRGHIQREEEEFYPLAEARLVDDELERLDEEASREFVDLGGSD